MSLLPHNTVVLSLEDYRKLLMSNKWNESAKSRALSSRNAIVRDLVEFALTKALAKKGLKLRFGHHRPEDKASHVPNIYVIPADPAFVFKKEQEHSYFDLDLWFECEQNPPGFDDEGVSGDDDDYMPSYEGLISSAILEPQAWIDKHGRNSIPNFGPGRVMDVLIKVRRFVCKRADDILDMYRRIAEGEDQE